ncbi:MAG: hypothetical protein ACI936_001088 [Paraglaciecola sp.]|jgi:hypothetical protein
MPLNHTKFGVRHRGKNVLWSSLQLTYVMKMDLSSERILNILLIEDNKVIAQLITEFYLPIIGKSIMQTMPNVAFSWLMNISLM